MEREAEIRREIERVAVAVDVAKERGETRVHVPLAESDARAEEIHRRVKHYLEDHGYRVGCTRFVKDPWWARGYLVYWTGDRRRLRPFDRSYAPTRNH